MRNFTFLFVLLLLAATGVHAQQRTCSTMDHLQYLKDKDPAAEKNHEKHLYQVNEWVRTHADDYRSAGGAIVIPTVVHVVYANGAQNIPDNQVLSQIDVLNRDFRRLNTDTTNTPAVWQNVMGDAGIEFCLAQRDPQGNPTTGIVRVPTSVNSFGINDGMKFNSSGGSDAWPRDEYLNIWVCNLQGGLLGYAQFPGQAANTDGVAVDYQFFGTINTQPPFNTGRTTTHEVGHWLGLFHIWGDDGGACSGSDNIADTPNQGNSSSGCPSFPATDNCATTSPGYMFMNYMDYSNDNCMNGFTVGQGTRMQGVLSTTRSAITNSDGCVPVNLEPNDAQMQAINSPTGTNCATSITPEIEVFNRGQNALTSFNVNWSLDQGPTQTQAWTGNLPSLGTVTITLPTTPINAGNHDLVIWTSDPNGVNDDDPTNDTLSTAFVIQTVPTGGAVPFVEDFEGGFPPSGWTINNPDNDDTWELASVGAGGSARSAYINYYDYAAPGERDEMILPALDLTNGSAPVMTFDLSYKLYSTNGFSDTLHVYVSTDCGATWTNVYTKFDQALTTATPFAQQSPWVPSTNAHWRNESIDLSAYAGVQGVQIKFVAANDYENNLYIDNVNVLGFVGVETELPASAVQLSPNPGHDYYRLDINLPEISEVEVSVVNAVGQQVSLQRLQGFSNGRVELDLSGQAAGIYFVRVKTTSGATTRKLIRQ